MNKKDILKSILLIITVSAILIPFASQSPDGLEKIASEMGFAAKESASPAIAAPFADYRLPEITNGKLSSAAAGILGSLIMFGTGWGVAVLLKRRKGR